MGKKRDTKAENALMKKVFDMLPPLPANINEWANENPLGYSKYLFTRRVNGVRYGYCTHCNTESVLSTSAMQTYTWEDSENEQHRHNDKGFCPNCRSRVVFKDAGRGHKKLWDDAYIMVLQPMPDGGIVVSAAFCARDYTKDYHNVQTKYDPQYIMYFNEGQAITFRKSYVYNYGYQWIPMASIPEPGNPQNFWGSVTYKTYCMDCTPETLQNTFFRYCPISNSMKIKKPQLMGKFFALYAKHPVLVERLIKQGFIKVVEEKISRYKNGASPVVDWKKTTVAEALNLDKSGVRAYAKKSLREMAAYQLAYKFGILNPADIEWINEKMTTHDSPKDLSLLLKYASVTKLRQYTNKITKTKKGYASFGDYVDYIRQCQQLKLDLKQKSILYPQDFVQAHAQNTAMLAEIKAEKEMKAAAEIDAAFAVKCKRLAKKYEYTDGTLLIRPAAGKRELFVEGKTLGHCVYTDYADSYIKGELIILFIRKVSNPNIPYYTLELSKEGKIRQCRGKGNCAMTAGVKAFADKWQEELEAPKTKQNKKVASAPAV